MQKFMVKINYQWMSNLLNAHEFGPIVDASSPLFFISFVITINLSYWTWKKTFLKGTFFIFYIAVSYCILWSTQIISCCDDCQKATLYPGSQMDFLNMIASSFFWHSKNCVEKFPEITITMVKREYFRSQQKR